MKRFVILVLLFCGITHGAEPRTWTDQSGKFNVRATLASVKVVLAKEDGTTIEVPFDRLIKADQDYVWKAIAGVEVVSGKVVRVTDGDTITVLEDKTQHTIRLVGLDAPEGGQEYGQQSRQALTSKILEKHVRVEWREKDYYKRSLGNIYLDGRWINKEMVAEGWAWHYKEYSDDKELAKAESKAREARAGLWADKDPMPPWDYRRTPPEDLPPALKPVPPPPSKPRTSSSQTQTHWITSSSGIRHNSGCRYYRNSKGSPCGSNAGRACKICGG